MKEKTRKDLVQYFKDSDFEFTEFGDYERNLGAMSGAVQFMGRDWYIEEMQPTLNYDCGYAVADYYDDIVNDVIVFETEIHRKFQMSPEEIADYMWMLNERYKDVKEKYESMYNARQLLKKLFKLFKNRKDEGDN